MLPIAKLSRLPRNLSHAQTAFLALALLLTDSHSLGQTATPSPAVATVTAAAPKPAAAPIPPPNPVPDNVNPFTDKDNPPVPLKLTSSVPMKVEVRRETFDGMEPMQMFISGPDFEWRMDPLDSWIPVTPAFGESLALGYLGNPKLRLGLTLYGNELMPDITPQLITQYLAAARDANTKSFVLLTPIPKDLPSLEVNYFAAFRGQSVDYAIISPTVVLHHTWFMDGNKQYVLVMDLSGTPAFVKQVQDQIRFTFTRSHITKGLTTKPATTAPAPSASTVPTGG